MTPGTRATIVLCARQELAVAVRTRWTQIFAIVFGGLTLAVAGSGYVLSGGSGVQDFARTAASLVQVVLLLVPLAALLLGVMALTPDPGAAELLYSQPVARRTILAGKLMGLFVALTAAQAVGFGAAGLVIFARTGRDGLSTFLVVIAGATALTAVFLALAAALVAGDTSTRRSRGLALALVCWLVVVVLFDVAALGVTSLLPSGVASRVLMTAAILNPVDAVRTGALLSAEGTTAFGGASLAFLRFAGGMRGALLWPVASLIAWTVVFCAIAARRVTRADI
ncbi:MAG TPA: ABC transporter permease subunit [Vicinamibacterales bacterium]|nr:ABC transporter permease subunit [Vicinamibacterales bacterium]